MIDHAAEARHILAGTSIPSNSETGRGAYHQEPSLMELQTATVHALLAIAAIADAIRDTGRTDETCDAIRTEADGALIDTTWAKFYPCRRHLGHAGHHRDWDGDTW